MLKISYICHAAMLVEADGMKIVTDPWIKGPAYCGQWHLFPKPVDYTPTLNADYILYSHGHEDHCHPTSLELFDKKAKVFFPYSWYDGAKDFFGDMGFKHVTEAINEKTYHLNDNTSITYFSNNLDNIIVIEHGDEVLVDVNDALHSAPQILIEKIAAKITAKWKKIDYVFSSYGGASYFPNCFKFKGKDDVEIAKTRELFFLNNFCKIMTLLKPKYAIPFASDFVLLDDAQRWMNETRFPRNKIQAYFKNYMGNSPVETEVIDMYPGDFIQDGKFNLSSPYRASIRPEGLTHLIYEEYKTEIAEKKEVKKISDAEAEDLFDKLKNHVRDKLYIIPEEKRKEIKYAIQLTDYSDSVFYTIDLKGAVPKVYKSPEFEKDCILSIKMRSETLLFSMENEWGGDAIIIGYGCEVEVFELKTIEHGLDNLCVRLLTNYPNTKEYLMRLPFRAIRYLMTDPIKRQSLISGAKFTDPKLSDNMLWLSKTKCQICNACNLPEQLPLLS
jgi:hypothetical protein